MRPTLLLLTLATLSLPSPLRAEPVTIALSGSIRGHLGPMTDGVQAQTVSLVADLRKAHPHLVLLCAGNTLGPGVTSEVDTGRQLIRVMNRCRYDAAGLGYTDLLFGVENFLLHARRAQFPFLCANLRSQGEAAPSTAPLRASTRIARGGKEVFVTAVVPSTLPEDCRPWPKGLVVDDPEQALARLRPRAAGADLVVVLSSLGVRDNLRLLKKLPWVDLIASTMPQENDYFGIGLREIALEDGRRLVPTYRGGRRIALVRAQRDEGGVDASVERLVVDPRGAADPVAARTIARLEERTEALHGRVIARLDAREAGDFPRLFLQALCCAADAEAAFIDRASLERRSVPRDLTFSALRQAFPYENRVAVVLLSGAKLRELWKKRDKPLVWGQGLHVVGLAHRHGKLLVNGRPLREQDRYRVATTDYLVTGGLTEIPNQAGAVRPQRICDVLAAWLRRLPPGDLTRRYEARSRRPVVRRKVTADVSYSRLAFGGAADRYQYTEPNLVGLGSAFPELVGTPNDSWELHLALERIVDKPGSELTIRFKGDFATWSEYTYTDRGSFVLRREDTRPHARTQWFWEANLTGTLSEPATPGVERPLLGKAIAGLRWKAGRHAKAFAGLGRMVRFSERDEPENTGLNLALELDRTLPNRANLEANLEVFGSADSDQVRSADGSASLRVPLTGSLASVVRYRKFLWRENGVDETATREEVYVGLSFSRALRR